MEKMKKIMYWMLVAILISGASVFTACTNDDNETVDTEVSVTPSQSRVGYSAWNTQVSYTHCDPLPKTGKPELVSGTWEMNDGILQHKACEKAPLAICNYIIPYDHYTIQCSARKDSGEEGFIIVFNYVDAQHYCWLNFGCEGNTQHVWHNSWMIRKERSSTPTSTRLNNGMALKPKQAPTAPSRT